MNTLKFALIGTSIALATTVAAAEQVGVIGLYEEGTALNDAAVANLGCDVQREGRIFAAQGKLSPPLRQPGQFVVLDCDQSVLGSAERRNAVSALFADGKAIAVFEGALKSFQASDGEGKVGERQYILKLGYYNNRDTDGREVALSALDEKASQLDGHWTNEAYLNVHDAMGIPTPDEVVVIHYESAEVAENFRNANSGILQDVGAFNDAHLTAFTYLVGTAVR